MDCPTCKGNGELECHACESEQNIGKRDQNCTCSHCRGNKIVICYRCSGSGHLETISVE